MKEIRKKDPLIQKLFPGQKLTPGVRYIPSHFSLEFRISGKNYIFNTLTRQLIEGEMPQSCYTEQGNDGLIKDYILVPEGKDENVFYTSVLKLLKAYGGRKQGIHTSYTILPTYACNARWVYCYEEGMKPVSMTAGVIDQTINYIKKTCHKGKAHLHWFGGEPLLGIQTIDRICEGLREEGIEYKSSMTSNGSLITEEVIGKMKNLWHLNKLQISMDGPENDYILRKKYIAYQDYYHGVLNSISRMSEEGIYVNIRCNVDDENVDRIPEFLNDLKTGIRHRDKVSVYFCPLNDTRMGETCVPVWKKILGSDYLISKAGFRSNNLSGSRGTLRTAHCMANGGNIVISPDGGLYPCEQCSDEIRIGNVSEGITAYDRYHEFCRTDQVREKCRDCPFLPDCTSFAACPIEDSGCRQVRETALRVSLEKLIAERNYVDDSEVDIC